MHHSLTRVRVCLLVLAILLTVGCASKTQGEKKVRSFTKTRDFLASAQNQVDITLVRMNSLRATPAGTLDQAFKEYKESVAQLEKQGEEAKWQAKALKEEADTHMNAWQTEMEQLTDPSIKASMEKRRDAVRSNFAQVKMYAQDARKAYEPFLKGNQQMVQALSLDLSPATLTSLEESMGRIMSDGLALKQKLSAMQHAMNNIAAGLSPIGL